MSQLINSQLFQQIKRTPLLQFHRYRGKINIQRPRKPHYDRALVNAVTEPSYPKPPKTNTCFQKLTREVVENPYNDIIAREVRNWLDHSKVVGIFHLNSIKSENFFNARVKFHKQNMQLKIYGYKIMEKAVKETRYEALLQLFEKKHWCIVFSAEQKVSELIKIARKFPQMILLAGVVDNTLLSRNELMHYAQIPNLQSVQAELVQTLNSAASTLVQNLEAHQKNFVNILDVYTKSGSERAERNNSVNLKVGTNE